MREQPDAATFSPEKSAQQALAPDMNAMLRRFLENAEKGHRKNRVEIACAVILALATMSSAWCAYQSKLWSGTQSAKGGAANSTTQKAAEKRLLAFEFRSMEASLFIKYLETKKAGNEKEAAFLETRLFPHTKAALKAWLKTDPFHNPKAPRTPFLMPEYKQPLWEEAKKLDQDAAAFLMESRQAGQNSDTYVLLTVLFASVLFFGGIGGTFQSLPLRRAVLTIAVVLFLVTFTGLVTMPSAWS
jgi:hypothetical protein